MSLHLPSISYRFDFDFYLQAHAGLKGTVKPTHYNVIYDENSMGADEIQVGTHDSSYMYARATKAVSLIPAAYYADLACERGRIYMNKLMLDDGTTTAGGTRTDEAEETWRNAVRLWGTGVSAFSIRCNSSADNGLLAPRGYEENDVLYLIRNRLFLWVY